MPDLDMQALLSASQAAAYAGRSVQVICNWAARGHLPVAKDARGREIRDGRGRPRYRLIDVAKAEAATSQRGEKIARAILTRRAPDDLAA